MHPLLLGIDFGTASSKGVLTTADGAVVAETTRPTTLREHPGWAEVDAEETWRDELFSIARELTTPPAVRRSPASASAASACLLCDEQLDPCATRSSTRRHRAPADRRAAPALRHAAIVAAAAPTVEQAVGPKLLGARERAGRWQRARRWFNPNSTPSPCSPANTCSTTTRPASPTRSTTSPATTSTTRGATTSPELERPRRLAGGGRRRRHARGGALSGLAAGTPVVTGTIDAWSEALSVGVRAPGDTMLMYARPCS